MVDKVTEKERPTVTLGWLSYNLLCGCDVTFTAPKGGAEVELDPDGGMVHLPHGRVECPFHPRADGGEMAPVLGELLGSASDRGKKGLRD